LAFSLFLTYFIGIKKGRTNYDTTFKGFYLGF